MLIVKVFLNEREIDSIALINTGHIEDGKHLYRFRKPKELNHLEIYHNRNEPWGILVEKALNEYNKNIA